MKNFVIAITTYNRVEYLKKCIHTWVETKNNNVSWVLVVADDGSTDGTLDYLSSLNIENTTIVILQNNRLGVHQQMNTILSSLENTDYDFCFKVDDDITFLKPGWDKLYYETAQQTGSHHLIFCDENWCSEQFLEKPKTEKTLIGNVPMLHAHGFFYTFSPEVIKKVGSMDTQSFGFRGMGHVDFSMRCARAGYTNEDTPWDVLNSNQYISATKQDYKSVLPNSTTAAYDEFNRKRKEEIIQDKQRVFIPQKDIDPDIYIKFKGDLIKALSDKVTNFEVEKSELISWYENEFSTQKKWYSNRFDYLPNWYIKLGKIFKLFK